MQNDLPFHGYQSLGVPAGRTCPEYAMDPKTREILVIITVSLGTAMGIMAMSSINIALPAVMADFNTTLGIVSWVLNGYLVVMAGSLVIFGRLADSRGLKKTFLEGIVIFTCASLLCSISSGILVLIAARVLQAVGASMFIATGPALITAGLPSSGRGRSLSYLTIVAGIGAALGVGLGGFLIGTVGWRWIFLLNIPLGALVLLSGKYLPEDSARARSGIPIDIRGSLLLSGTLVLALAGLSLDYLPGPDRSMVWVLYAGAAGLAAVFFFHLWKKTDPVLNLALFSNRNFSCGVASSFLISILAGGIGFFFPYILVVGLHVSPIVVGIILMVAMFGSILAAPYVGSLADTYGSRPVCISAAVIICASTLVFTVLIPDQLFFVAAVYIICRAGIGLYSGPSTKLILDNTSEHEQGSGLGILLTTRYAAYAIGIVLVIMVFEGAVFAAGLPDDGTPVVPRLTPELELIGYSMVFLLCTGIAVLAILFSIRAKDAVNPSGKPGQPEFVEQDLLY